MLCRLATFEKFPLNGAAGDVVVDVDINEVNARRASCKLVQLFIEFEHELLALEFVKLLLLLLLAVIFVRLFSLLFEFDKYLG